MIRQDLTIPKYGWKLRIYYEVTSIWTDLIMEDLKRLGISGKEKHTACSVVSKSDLNTGLTYSDFEGRESVMVVCHGSEGLQFFNSLIHEALHVQRHICEALAISPYSEDAAYLMGDICGMMYPKIKHLLCGCRKHKVQREGVRGTFVQKE